MSKRYLDLFLKEYSQFSMISNPVNRTMFGSIWSGLIT